MDSLNIISYFSVAPNTEIRVIHKLKKKNFYHPDFFLLVAISASNDHFALGDWGEFQDSIFFAIASLREHPVFSAQVSSFTGSSF